MQLDQAFGMSRARKVLLWLTALPILAGFFLCVGAGLHVRLAVKNGALTNIGWTCVSHGDQEKRGSTRPRQIEDYFLVRKFMSTIMATDTPAHPWGGEGQSSCWAQELASQRNNVTL